jgi:CheY-like chemotaxis protein
VLLYNGAPGAMEPPAESLPGWQGCLLKPVRARLLARAVERLCAPQGPGGFLTRDVLVYDAASAPRATQAGPAEFEGRHVLVVEDNATNQKVVRRLLEKLGCTVTIAGNGLEALDRLAGAAFDLVLMDCQMPEMDGFEATRQIRRSDRGHAAIPIVALTANAMASDREACLDAGMDDFVTKPVRPEELGQALGRWFGRTSTHATSRAA